MEELSKFFDSPVLRYVYAGDHGWGFAMAHNGVINLRYESYWDDGACVSDKDLQMEVLRQYLLPEVDPCRLETRLRAPTAPVVDQVPLAYEFAAALGLPRFQWLSPSYVTGDFKQGVLPRAASVVGEPNPDPVLPQPPLERIVIPRLDLSALEASQLLTPRVLEWDPHAHCDLVSSSGDTAKRDSDGPLISSDGRIRDHGEWSIRFISKDNGVVVFMALTATGEIRIRTLPININTRLYRRPDSWIDSPELLQIAEPIYKMRRKSDSPPLYDRILRLGPWGADDRWVWTLMYFCHAKGTRRWDLNLVVDACSGEVIDVSEREA